MATRTETIYTYICKPQGGPRGMRDRRYQVDVCERCLSRPIADVLTFCRGHEHSKPSRRGVVRIADH